MKYLSAALVTIACMVPMVLGDIGVFDVRGQHGYDVMASIALAGFALLCMFGKPSS